MSNFLLAASRMLASARSSTHFVRASLVFCPFQYLLDLLQNIHIWSYTLDVAGGSLNDFLELDCSVSLLVPLELIESRSFFIVKILRHLR